MDFLGVVLVEGFGEESDELDDKAFLLQNCLLLRIHLFNRAPRTLHQTVHLQIVHMLNQVLQFMLLIDFQLDFLAPR